MNIHKAFDIAFKQKEERGWDCIYVAIDLHGTIFKPSFSKSKEQYIYYPFAKETLQMMSRRTDVKLILWSSTPLSELNAYFNHLYADGIYIEYMNENPEVKDSDSAFASFKNKFYFNVGLDDKFGFEPEVDWFQLKGYFLAKAICR